MRINFTRILNFFTKLEFGNFENTSEIKGKILNKGKLSRSCRRVDRFAGKEQTSSRTGIAYYNSQQNTASSIHSKRFLYELHIELHINKTLSKERRKQESKGALTTS